MFEYNNSEDLKRLTVYHGMKISEIAIVHEAELEDKSKNEIVERMKHSVEVMRENIKTGINSTQPSIGGLIGTSAKAMHDFYKKGKALSGDIQSNAIAYALAVTEENARMKRIVACPTAGACGVVPGCLIAACEAHAIDDDRLINAMFNASAIGVIIAYGATVSGAQGGCQAEVGTASAMAASALTELMEGSVDECLNAAAIALKNVLGLVCDPVAGLVEVPCSKRNAMGVANAIAAADMARAHISSVIPFDEVVVAMKQVGRSLPFELRETSKGGVAASKTAKEISKKIIEKNADIIKNS